jgi:UDP-N-acetylmuramate dehydrogenase
MFLVMNYKLRKDVSLKYLTTYRIGGVASYFFIPESIAELRDVLGWAKEENVPWFCLGMGSNVLINDQGFPGLVVKLGTGLKRIETNESEDYFTVGGGCLLPRLGMTLMKQGIAGFEYMCVIPGTVGAAVRINAGTKEGEIKDKFLSADILMPDLREINLTKEDMKFSYRHSDLIGIKGLVLSARFQIRERESPEGIQKRIQEMIARKKSKQPQNPRNCGSVFKNPNGEKPAGWYIEQAGLKGMRKGDAQIATEHANWIVNLGKATATDVKYLIHHAQEKVFDKFGVELRREMIYVPEDIL